MLRALLVGLAFSVMVTAGCATAPKPWQRGMLAKSKMKIDPDRLSTLLELHVYEYREGSVGGYGVGGGGCGCN